MPGIFRKLSGVINSFFQVGGQTGPAIKNSSGVVELRNAGDTEYAKLNVSQPSTWTNNAVVTAKMLEKAFTIAGQFDATVADPPNTGTLRYLICTTAGNSYSVGDIAFDNGLSTGNASPIAAFDGAIISIPAALTGGTPEFATTGAYVRLAGTYTLLAVSSVTGINKVISVPFVFGDSPGTKASTATIPSGATIISSRVRVTTAFDAGTLSTGYTGSVSLLQTTTDNDLTAIGLYLVDGTTANASWASTIAVLLTLTGAPTAGAGEVIVEYSTPAV